MQELIIGAGAVGLGIGTALLAAGRRVTFVARGEVANRLRTDGLTRSGLFGKAAFHPDRFAVIDRLGECSDTPSSILVAVKSPASETVAGETAACPALRSMTGPIVLFQNGVGNAERFAVHHPKARIFNAMVITGFHLRSPTHVEITAHANPIRIGSLFVQNLDPIEGLAAAIAEGGIPCETAPDIERDLWAKLLYNASLNPVGALLGLPYGALADRVETRGILDAVMDEVFEVLRAQGTKTHWADAATYRAHFYEHLLPPTAAHESSMLQDIRAGRPTEIEALSGEIVVRGRALGVATPVSHALLTLVRARASAETR